MKKMLLKTTLAAMMLCGFGTVAQAQFLRTSFLMDGTSQRMQLNPAFAPTKGYFYIPVIGALNSSVNSNSLGFQDVKDIIGNSENGSYFRSDAFLNRLKNVNDLQLNLSTDILSAGWWAGRNFWSVNVGVRTDAGARIQKSMFEFLREMDQRNSHGESLEGYLGINSHVGAQKVELNAYTQVGLGLARSINERLQVGAKVNFLLGLAHAKLTFDNLDVKTPARLDNVGVTGNTPNMQADLDLNATLEYASQMLDFTNGSEGYIDAVKFGKVGISGYGVSVDLGASYRLLDNLTLSASLLDLGFISWGKEYSGRATSKANRHYTFTDAAGNLDYEGMNRFSSDVANGELLNFDLLQLTHQKEVKASTTSLATTVVLGAEYTFFNDKLAAGLLYTGRFVKPKSLNDVTLNVAYRPTSQINLAASYSVLQAAGKSLGLAVKLGPVLLGTDYMFFGNNTKNLNAYIGIATPLGGKKK